MDPRAAELEALRQALRAAGCTDGRQPIAGGGPLDAPLCIVGEGPAERDEQTGRPFSGPAGALLRQALAEAGADPAALFYTNVLLCRAVTVQDGREVNRPPTAGEIAGALPVLRETLRLVAPGAVIGLGATAGGALLGKGFQFRRDRGQWFRPLEGPPVITTYLPAYVLRRQGPDYVTAYAALLDDLRTALAGPP